MFFCVLERLGIFILMTKLSSQVIWAEEEFKGFSNWGNHLGAASVQSLSPWRRLGKTVHHLAKALTGLNHLRCSFLFLEEVVEVCHCRAWCKVRYLVSANHNVKTALSNWRVYLRFLWAWVPCITSACIFHVEFYTELTSDLWRLFTDLILSRFATEPEYLWWHQPGISTSGPLRLGQGKRARAHYNAKLRSWTVAHPMKFLHISSDPPRRL